MSVVLAFLLLAMGSAIGFAASITGVGGGFIIVPTLILIFHLPAQQAIAVSLVAIWGTSLSATTIYARQRRVDFKLSLLYDLLDVPGVIIGAYLTTLLPSNLLAGVCGSVIVFLSVLLATHKETVSRLMNGGSWKRKRVDSSGQVFEYVIRRPGLALTSSFMGGLVTGLCGLGGGITDASTMILLSVPPHIAVASSEFAMAITGGAGVLAHGLLKNIVIAYALPITIGTIIGAQLGGSISRRVKAGTLRKLLSLIVFLLGLRLIYMFFQPLSRW